MKKYIVKAIKDKLEQKHNEWANNYVAERYQDTLGTPEGQKQVEAAKVNMKLCEETIKFLKTLLKVESE